MNANAQKWIQALRSGRFKQGFGQLHGISHDGDQETFCCLGVACVLYAEENEIEVDRNAQIGPYEMRVQYGESLYYLPEEVREWLGLTTSKGHTDDLLAWTSSGADITTLAGLNDYHHSFDTIADTIESEPAGLFKEDSL